MRCGKLMGDKTIISKMPLKVDLFTKAKYINSKHLHTEAANIFKLELLYCSIFIKQSPTSIQSPVPFS